MMTVTKYTFSVRLGRFLFRIRLKINEKLAVSNDRAFSGPEWKVEKDPGNH